MGAAFLGSLPEAALSLLLPGDAVFTSDYNSPMSWAIMYFTSSDISHTATYAGHRLIAHATLSGLVMDQIDVLYRPTTRILAVRINRTLRERDAIVERMLLRLGEPYGWHAVRRKLVWILTGRDAPYFRWRFAADIALIVVCLDLLVQLWVHRPTVIWTIVAYLVLIVVNLSRWHRVPLSYDAYVKPCDILKLLKAEGSRRVADANALAVQGQLPGL
jgi:hypothetical protein